MANLAADKVLEDFKKLFTKNEEINNHFDECLMHAEGVINERVLTRRQNEDEATRQWRYDNFRAISRSLWQRGLNMLSRIFKSSGFSKYISDPLNDYLKDHFFHNMHIEQWLELNALPLMIKDPNGYVAVLYKYEEVEIFNEDTQKNEDSFQILFDEYGKPQVELKYISSKHFYYKDDDNFIWAEDNLYEDNLSVTELLVNNFFKKKKCFYWLNKDVGFIEVKIEDGNPTPTVIYEYQWQELPVSQFKGQMHQHHHKCDVYHSYFDNFLPWADEAICSFSDLQALLATSAYPIKEMLKIECQVEGCSGGLITDTRTNEQHSCRSCSGTGYGSNIGVFNVIEKPIDREGRPLTDQPMLTFITPPLEPIDKLTTSYIQFLEKAEQAIFLSYTLEAQSGIAKTIDRDDMVSFLAKVSNNLFTYFYADVLKHIEFQLYGQIVVLPTVSAPTDFLVYSEDYLLEKIETTTIKFLKVDCYRELIDRRWSGRKSEQNINKWNLFYNIIKFDDELTKSDKLDSGKINLIVYKKDQNYYEFFQQLIEQFGEKAFNELSLRDLDQFLTTYVIELINAEAPQAPAAQLM